MSSQLLFFILGNGSGIYLAQNYKMLDIKSWLNTTFGMLKKLEETSRKDN